MMPPRNAPQASQSSPNDTYLPDPPIDVTNFQAASDALAAAETEYLNASAERDAKWAAYLTALAEYNDATATMEARERTMNQALTDYNNEAQGIGVGSGGA